MPETAGPLVVLPARPGDVAADHALDRKHAELADEHTAAPSPRTPSVT
jgi:hypothetical protein